MRQVCMSRERLRKDSPFFFSSFSFLSMRKASFSCSVYIMRRTLSTKENPSSPPSLAPSAIVAAGDRQQQTLLRTTNFCTSPLLCFYLSSGSRSGKMQWEGGENRQMEPPISQTMMGKWKQWDFQFTCLSKYFSV